MASGAANCLAETVLAPPVPAPVRVPTLRRSARYPTQNGRLIAFVFLPFAAGYYLSYLFRSINAPISARLTSDLALSAADLGLLSGPAMTEHKLAAILEFARELLESSSAEVLVRQALLESLARGLDAVLFDNVAGDAVRPPGLRNGVAGLTPSSSTDKSQAMADDVIALGSAVGAVTGGPLTFVAAPAQALALALRTVGSFPHAVLASSALAAGTVICVATDALAVAVGAGPEIDASRVAEIHRADPASAIADGGSMVAPVASIFQCDTVALRLRWSVSWARRASGAVSHMPSVLW